MFGLNRNQWFAILIVVASVLMVSTTQLNDIFGQSLAKKIIAVAGLMNGIFGGVLAVLTGQAQMVKDVSNMQGVETVKINAQANPTLARVALDKEVQNVEAASGDAVKLGVIADQQ
jgi:hypothetical protein